MVELTNALKKKNKDKIKSKVIKKYVKYLVSIFRKLLFSIISNSDSLNVNF